MATPSRRSSPGAVYLDTSALMKLVVREPQSRALREALGGGPRMVSSALAITELLRSARRCGSAAEDLAIQLLSRVAFRPIDYRLLLSAGRVAPVKLRSLDAIHVATALALGAGLDVVYSYDRRFLAAAAAHDLRTAAPA